MAISRDIPLAELTLRRYEKIQDLKGRDLIKKLCLSMGLLQPGDSRDVIVDVFQILLKHKELDSEQIKDKVIEMRKHHNLPQKGIASSNIRRQLKRLKDIHFIEKKNSIYQITENNLLHDIFTEKVEGHILPQITSRIKDYLKAIDKEYFGHGDL